MSFSVLLLVLFGAALHATWNGLVKGGKDKYLETVGMLAGAALLTLLWLPFLPLPARASWPYLAASTLIHQVYFLLIVLSYRKGDMSLVYPVTRGTAPALTALCSEIVLHERLTFAGWAGVLLVSGGVLVLAFDHKRSESFHLTPVLLALANAAVIALYTLSDGQGARLSGNTLSYTSWGFLLCAVLFIPVALLIRKQEAIRHLKAEWRRSLFGGGCSLVAYGLALWAMTRAPIASVAALREISILFGVLIAAFTLKERVTGMRIVAALLIVAGAVVIKIA
ncbi:MAG: EamA family transporter [Chthonomonadaceae bacterium]|nr:EamA family transporter [Chthonomonadaceae bacterium]